jgi:hypothetical protein
MDNLKRYRAIMTGLKQLYPKQLSGRQMQHMQVLAAIISGIVGSQKSQLPAIANKMTDGTQRQSRIMRLSRWLKNKDVNAETYFAPFAQALLVSLAHLPLVLVIDGSTIGRGCMCLMVSVIYKRRALPLGWVVFEGSKGHGSQARHREVLQQVKDLVPAGAEVVVVGDGEFDGVEWLQTLADYGWFYVCRTAKNAILLAEQDRFCFAEWGVSHGECLSAPDVQFTEQGYGPLMAIAWWDDTYEEPIFLVTNLELAEEACAYYRQRFLIETFFSDQKSRGFNLHKSHLSDPQRLARLLIAACLAYLWIVYLGNIALTPQWRKRIHRSDRCDLSLFQLGLALLDQFFNDNIPIPVAFHVQSPSMLNCVG